MIKFWSYKRELTKYKNNLNKQINNSLNSGNIFFGDQLNLFEKRFILKNKSKYGIAVGSGTDALLIALKALEIKKGDEVITSPLSFVATTNSIIHVGAKPVFVDVGDDLNMDPNLIEKVITKKTKAIMPVHWTGRVCKMDKILSIAKKYNLTLIEDAAAQNSK